MMREADLSGEHLVVTGSPYCEKSKNEITFSRFPVEILRKDEAELSFNPNNAKSASGTMLHFRSDASKIKLSFTFGEGMKRGSAFAIYQNGELAQEMAFVNSLNTIKLEFGVLNPGRATDYRIVFPGYSNPILNELSVNETAKFLKPKVPEFRYVAMGDSISHGSGQRLGVYKSWPFLLAENLKAQLYNVAIGGARVSLQVAQTLSEYPCIDLLTILIGYNDCNAGVTPEDFMAKYIKAIRLVRQNHPETPIICITPTFITRTKSINSDHTFDDFRDAAVGVVATLKEEGDSYIFSCRGEEITSVANLKNNRPADKTHFSEMGAEMMAEAMSGWIESNIPTL